MIISTVNSWKELKENAHKLNNFTVINSDVINNEKVFIPLKPKNRSEYITNNAIILSPEDFIFNIFSDKILFSEYMGINYPNNIPETVYYLNYPYLAKQRNSDGGSNIFMIKSLDDYEKYNIDDNFILQKYINSNIYIVGQYFIYNGNILFKKFYMRNVNYDYEIICGRIINYEKINVNDEIFIDLFNKTNYTGFACVDFTIKDDTIIIFEINPRIGGTFSMDLDDFNECFDIIYNKFKNI